MVDHFKFSLPVHHCVNIMLTTSAPLASTTIDHPNKSYSSHHHQIANLHCQPSACSTIALPHQHHQEDHRSSTLHPKFAPLLWATAPKSQTTKLTTKLLSSSIIIEVAKFHHSRGCEIPQLRQPLTANGSKFVTYEMRYLQRIIPVHDLCFELSLSSAPPMRCSSSSRHCHLTSDWFIILKSINTMMSRTWN